MARYRIGLTRNEESEIEQIETVVYFLDWTYNQDSKCFLCTAASSVEEQKHAASICWSISTKNPENMVIRKTWEWRSLSFQTKTLSTPD